MYKHYEKRNAARAARANGEKLLRAAALLLALALGFFFGRLAPEKARKEAGYVLPLTPAAYPTGAPEKESERAEMPGETENPAPTEAPADDAVVRLASSMLTVSLDGVPTEMELEEYLVGVVAAEMPASSEPEALRAQAIAARTFTALHMAGGARCKSGCTVCSDPSCCQGYMDGSALSSLWGEKYPEYLEKIRAAVRDTAGLVATYEGELISAVYHASSGPYTESADEVFACALPYLVSVESFEGEKEIVSSRCFSDEDAAALLNRAFPQAELTAPIAEGQIEVWGRSPSGRVQLVRVGATVVTGQQLRLALGLKSTAFTIESGGGTITFNCEGSGHGVGLSQTGANEMAKEGCGFREILSHFYTGTSLSRLVFGEG
jgi:stage II sporulation protein D